MGCNHCTAPQLVFTFVVVGDFVGSVLAVGLLGAHAAHQLVR